MKALKAAIFIKQTSTLLCSQVSIQIMRSAETEMQEVHM